MSISIRSITCAAAILAVVPVFAEDDEETSEVETSEAENTEAAAEASGDSDTAKKRNPAAEDQLFTVLPYCKRLEGRAEVRLPGANEWKAIEEGRFFPLGSVFRTCTGESRLEIAFGRDAVVAVVGVASFGTRQQGLAVKSRTVLLDSGTIDLKLPLNFPEKMFCVTCAGFCVENPAGVSRYTFKQMGDGTDAIVRCVSGMLTVRGRHFTIPAMHAANEVEIRTSKDVLYTGLFCKSGDYMCHLDNGLMQEMDYEQQKNVVVEKYIDWKLSPRTAVRIFRKVPEVGTNLAVSVMTFDANGELRNRCSFTEGRPEVNTGDQGPATRRDRERAAKALEQAAAAVVETSAAEETVESDEGSDESSSEE